MVDISTSRKRLSPSLQLPLTTITWDASSSLMTSTNPRMEWCNTLYFNYGHNVTFNFDYTLSWFNNYFATHKTHKSRSDSFLPDAYHIWDEVIWLTPEKGHLISTAPICWEQTEPSPKVSQPLNYND